MSTTTLLTKEALAAQLNGREYGSEITDAEAALAKQAGLVVVFGYSDDNVELRGAVVACLRRLCADFGDNDWPADLHLEDVIEKHLADHLYRPKKKSDE